MWSSLMFAKEVSFGTSTLVLLRIKTIIKLGILSSLSSCLTMVLFAKANPTNSMDHGTYNIKASPRVRFLAHGNRSHKAKVNLSPKDHGDPNLRAKVNHRVRDHPLAESNIRVNRRFKYKMMHQVGLVH